jgi:hypothetical protein
MSNANFGNGSLAIAICDYCGFKKKYTELRQDEARPGLRVCGVCFTKNHPIKTFRPRLDNYMLKYPRPDAPLFNAYVIVAPTRGPIQAVTPDYELLAVDRTPMEATGDYPSNSPLNEYLPPSVKKKYGIK